MNVDDALDQSVGIDPLREIVACEQRVEGVLASSHTALPLEMILKEAASRLTGESGWATTADPTVEVNLQS